jgi:hypothetical protein
MPLKIITISYVPLEIMTSLRKLREDTTCSKEQITDMMRGISEEKIDT